MDPIASSPGPTSATTAAAPSFPTSFPSSPLAARSLGAGALLAAIAIAALVMARRRRRAPRLIEIVESASLGPKRSLVVARMGDEILVLGSSESGIALLSTRPAPASTASRAAAAGPAAPIAPPSIPGRSLLELLRPRRRPAPEPFDALLAESVEDVELRRKLAAGYAGSVR